LGLLDEEDDEDEDDLPISGHETVIDVSSASINIIPLFMMVTPLQQRYPLSVAEDDVFIGARGLFKLCRFMCRDRRQLAALFKKRFAVYLHQGKK
jgi:hypothetical protein